MIYTILLLTLFSIVLLLRNYKNRYTWFFLLMIIGLDLGFFAITLYISKIGNYRYPDSVLFILDYKIYLKLMRLKINYYNIWRVMNIGIAIFLFIIPIFVYEYTNTVFIKKTTKTLIIFAALLVFPCVYIWFYDGNTSINFYLMIYDKNYYPHISIDLIKKFITVFHSASNLLILLYLFCPFYFLYRHHNETHIKLKRMQIISVAVCMLILNILFVLIFIYGVFRKSYFDLASTDLLLFFGGFAIPTYYFNVLPVIMLIAIQIMLFILMKFKGIDSPNFLMRFVINRNIKNLNANLKGVFHSFKNTFFQIKILAEKAESDYSTNEGLETVQKIQQVSSASLSNISRMLSSLNEISLRPAKCRLVDAVEAAIKEVYISKDIKIKRDYLEQDVYSYFDLYHLSQAIANIIKNSVEAIYAVNKKTPLVTIEINADHEWAIINITDNGPGIMKSDLKKIFNPFFSTKSKQNNWGIGLSYTYRVIKANLGVITVDSIEGEYTIFQILLPRIRGEKKYE